MQFAFAYNEKLCYTFLMEQKNDKYTDSLLEEISDIIGDYKRALDLTTTELSEKSGVSVGVISDLVTNRGRVPSLVNFIKIANALELSDDMILQIFNRRSDVKDDGKISDIELRKALIKYGLSKIYAGNILVQIDALIAHAKKNRERAQRIQRKQENKSQDK